MSHRDSLRKRVVHAGLVVSISMVAAWDWAGAILIVLALRHL